MVNIAGLKDTFSEFFKLEASPVEGQSLQQKEKEKKQKQKKLTKTEKLKDAGHFLVQKLSQNFYFCTCTSKNVVKCKVSRKKGHRHLQNHDSRNHSNINDSCMHLK